MNDEPIMHQTDKEARCAAFREQMIARWRSEIERIENEIVTLYGSRSIYRRLFKIVDANPRIQRGNAFYEWLPRNYVFYASTTLRKLLDNDSKVVSLGCLVQSIRKNGHLISREWYISEYNCEMGPEWSSPQAHLKWLSANEDFDKLVGVGKNTVDGNDLRTRLENIQSLSSLVLEYANKLIAHNDKKMPNKLPTYGHLDKAIDEVGDFFIYLHVLLNQSSFIKLEPVEEFCWEKLFEEPWIRRPDESSDT